MGFARRALVICVAALAAPAGLAQVDPAGLGARRDTFAVGDTLRLSAAPVPRSLTVTLRQRDSTGAISERRLADSEFALDAESRVLTLRVMPAESAEIVAAYRALDLGLRVVYRPARDTVEAPPEPAPGVRPPPPEEPAGPLFDDVRLRRSGSISRGLIAGNNRDLAVESGLRMELAGQVAEGVNVEAVLTDASTPILPEGTTQQLSEFDRVYVRLWGQGAEARLGDVDLALAGTRFAQLSRRVQGAAVETRLPALGPMAGGRVLAAGAAARGVFRSQSLQAVEGVQGPYRLTGAAGEAFVIVVPASERVYLDGDRLERGETADYVIDYATGEITFTSRRLITAERRITVDFEYSAGGFSRTLLVAAGEARLFARPDTAAPGLLVRTSFMREGDAAALSLALSEDDLDAIAAAGDGEVLVPGEERVPFDPASPLVLYARRDTVFQGTTYSIFVPAVAETDSVYRVRFSRVEAGRGSYRRAGSTQNGVLYRWVGPTGGDYIPFRQTAAAGAAAADRRPRRRGADPRARAVGRMGIVRLRQEYPVGARHGRRRRPGRGGGRRAPAAANRSAGHRRGFGPGRPARGNVRAAGPHAAGRLRSHLERRPRRGASIRGGYPLGDHRGGIRAMGNHAADGRNIEAGRIWLDDPETGSFEAGRVALVLAFDEASLASGYLPRANYRLDVADSRDRLSVDTLGAISEVRGRFVRGEGDIRKPLLGGRLTPSFGVRHEHRAQRGPDGTLLDGFDADTSGGAFALGLPASYAFVSLRPGLAWTTRALDASAGIEHRTEREPLAGALAPAADAIGADAEVRWRPAGPYGAEARVGWRRREFRDAFQALGREDAESVALRWTARAAPLRRAIDATATYEALTERAPVLQEAYVLVGPELGTHVWRDGEGEPRAGEPDGVAQVDEFFSETTPLEGSYARTFVPGDDLFPAVGVQAHFRVRLDPARLAGDHPGAAAAVARAVTLTTTVDVRERTREDDLLRVLLLDPGVLQRPGAAGDSLSGTLAGRFRLQQEATLFPANPRAGGRLAFAALSTTNRLAAGLERRRLRQLDAEARWTPAAGLSLRMRGGWSRDRSDSESFLTRTFDLTSWTLHPEMTWVAPRGVTLTAGLAFADRTNAGALAGQPAGARMWRFPVEARLARVGRLAATVRGEWASVDVQGGAPGGLLSYELTEGRGAGTSYLWGATLDYTLTRYLRASAFYDGRAPAAARVVHTFRMQLSASF